MHEHRIYKTNDFALGTCSNKSFGYGRCFAYLCLHERILFGSRNKIRVTLVLSCKDRFLNTSLCRNIRWVIAFTV